jgi:hypothetical protein
MDKRLLFPQNKGRERDIFFVKEDSLYLQKHASAYHPKIQDYVSKAKPIPDLIQVLITALGAYPFWPQNVNGDRFLEPALAHEGDDYGYQTFKTNANYFNHHINKDPALAKGKVLAAVWNERAKRVELILGINPSLDPDAAAEISNGNNLAFSMGAKLPFDVCSICGNCAKTRLEYCDHLKYQMNSMDPITGMLVGALNPRPKFFDISRVLIPADKTAYMWEKIASAADNSLDKIGSAELAETSAKNWFDDAWVHRKIAMKAEAWEEKRSAKRSESGSELTQDKFADIRKNSTITKEIPVTSVKPLFLERLKRILPLAKHALSEESPDMDMDQLKGFSLAQIVSTLVALGIIPKASESHKIYELFAGHSNQDATSFGPHAFHPDLARRLIPIAEQRSFARPILVRRIVILAKKPESELRKMAEEHDHKSQAFHAGLAAGILAAALAYSGHGGAIGSLIANHPILTSIFGAAAIRSLRTMGPASTVTTGEVSLAEPGNPLYNTNWQRRFAEAQAHPVTVIKTGADQQTVFEDTFGGIPFLMALEGISQQPAIQFLEQNPNILSRSLMTKESSALSQDVADVLTSARRFIKSASLESMEFLEIVPETSRHLVWDLAILHAADKIARKTS